MYSLERKDSLAMKLKILRTQYDLTQAQVAQRLGISQQTYSKYENKDDTVIDSETITKICALYGISADYLLGIDSSRSDVQPKKTAATLEDDDIDIIVQQVLTKLEHKGDD